LFLEKEVVDWLRTMGRDYPTFDKKFPGKYTNILIGEGDKVILIKRLIGYF